MHDTALFSVRGMYAESDVFRWLSWCLPGLSPVVGSVFQVLGLICTTWRLYFRLRIDRFWWEDAWAGAALLSCLISLVGQWVYSLTCKSMFSCRGFDVMVDAAHNQLQTICRPMSDSGFIPLRSLPSSGKHVLTAAVFMVVLDTGTGLYAADRATHLSILFSIARIVHDTRLGKFTYFCAVCCGIFWTIIVTGKIWQCASDSSWHHYTPPACVVKPQILIFEFTCEHPMRPGSLGYSVPGTPRLMNVSRQRIA
ncbi:hypothetical protein J3R83DRAFT_9570 [Lanmaoa asiatica]|nr:hypothetical protein J3R83DRAFT_9570 [Lanmaoa asiatica]